jgi:hypothetical protein
MPASTTVFWRRSTFAARSLDRHRASSLKNGGAAGIMRGTPASPAARRRRRAGRSGTECVRTWRARQPAGRRRGRKGRGMEAERWRRSVARRAGAVGMRDTPMATGVQIRILYSIWLVLPLLLVTYSIVLRRSCRSFPPSKVHPGR